ncbi:MAG TPA: ABC transporter substrate-binding protein [Acidimicrobiales bacterium]|nr:ABC transporter substrate-binding protein [Acidimicrobiales bacterium]
MRLSSVMKLTAVLACAGLILAACATSTPSTSKIPTGGTKVTGGVATFAEPPSATPNYIFPFETAQYDTVNNVSQFQYLLYRPLYMFGAPSSTSPTLNESLSLASLPAYSNNNTTAAITMKNYVWSNGEAVNATDVLFFMNMLHAETANWYSYVPGLFPDNVSNVTVNSSADQVTFTLKSSYNPTWFTDNELSQITPFPISWDETTLNAAPGSGKCSSGAYGAASTDTACTAVYNFLTAQAQASPSSLPSSSIWSVVDGPWKLSAFDSSGDVTMVPNTSYSGQKPTISEFQELPFTTDSAEFDALVDGKIDVGYLPIQDVTASTSNATVAGANNPRMSTLGYYLTPWVLFGYNYAVLKLTSIGDNGAAGKIFSQLYFRQALQRLVDQPLYISKIAKGYAVPTYGPVPVLPANPYADTFEESNPLPYSVSAAETLLKDHGWKVVPNGTDTCTNAGSGTNQCGAGIPAGTPLSFTMPFSTGATLLDDTIAAEDSSWKSAGINISIEGQTFDTVVGNYAPPCTSSAPCTEELGWWGGGWEYSPDYEPTGELLFATNAANNSSNWSDPMTDSLIAQTTTASTTNLDNYENYIATELPGVIWQPNFDYSLVEVKGNMRGVAPLSSLSTLFPEYWYFTS